MKQLSFVAVFLCGFVLAGIAQAKKPVTVKISTPTVQCGMCKKTIEKHLTGEQGVTKVTVDVKKKETTVSYFADRTNVENIKAGIANAGYDAEDVTANEDTYKNLPTCCKKPEDQ